MLQLLKMNLMRKTSFLVILLCVLIALKKEYSGTKKGSSTVDWFSSSKSASILTAPSISRHKLSVKSKNLENYGRPLEYDFYRESCPQAQQIIRSIVQHLYNDRSDIAPSLLRLVFHDCFVEGCDASVLLDATDEFNSEKESPPNETLRGFDVIEIIKSELEKACPRTVSCADILVLAARESVVLAGGPFYPLQTGRRDNTISFSKLATYELPSPQDDLPRIIALFVFRGFNVRETVSLLGAHSVGTIHCKFILNRLYNFRATDKPDPTLDIEFLNLLRSRCNNSHTSSSSSSSSSPLPSPSISPSSVDVSPSSSPQEPRVEMDYAGEGPGFGTLYYRGLLKARGILYVDQQLTTSEETESWVRKYASDVSLFQKDFALAMMKLSNLRVLTLPMGQVRISCSRVA